jgi:hypothetical protein
MKQKNSVTKAIQDKHVEVHYNEKQLYVNGENIHIELQGKINCPVLNSRISSLVCSKLMDQNGWPRNCDSCICDNAHCKIYKSIKKNIADKNDRRYTKKKTK